MNDPMTLVTATDEIEAAIAALILACLREKNHNRVHMNVADEANNLRAAIVTALVEARAYGQTLGDHIPTRDST